MSPRLKARLPARISVSATACTLSKAPPGRIWMRSLLGLEEAAADDRVLLGQRLHDGVWSMPSVASLALDSSTKIFSS
jgi:hypothetical protein